MAREISRAENWETAHEIFTRVNFTSFDFNTVKESLLDYLKLYYPESFNDFIESSEFVTIIELFAYISELMAYRIDQNAHENIISTAQRKESVLRLAKFVSYKVSRNVAARGFVKITSIQTSETIYDSNGKNLAGKTIVWDDNNNPNWKEQFIFVMNKVTEQDFGTVSPKERVQIDDVLFELYTLNNQALTETKSPVFTYEASTNTDKFPMELVSAALTEDGVEEKRPETGSKFSLLYASDGLGDSSNTTGFLIYTKQGTLHKEEAFFDGITPTMMHSIDVANINETDVWVNHVNQTTRTVLTEDPAEKYMPHLVSKNSRYGDWIGVDLSNGQNILFNTNKNRHKYEIETLDNDKIRLIFGDGEFSDIPSGAFDIWYRISKNSNAQIDKSSVVEKKALFTYIDAMGSVQTLTFTFSLISSLQNGSESEDKEHVRRVTPSVYYTQDRMVNGRDYNTFMLQDPSILKMRAVNRTFAGDSKYIAWHDPKESYEDVKIFGDDLALYWDYKEPSTGNLTVISTKLSANAMLKNYIEPLLSTTDMFATIGPKLESMGFAPGQLRRLFNGSVKPYVMIPPGQPANEIDAITEALNLATTTQPIVDLYYSTVYDEWTVGAHPFQLGNVNNNTAYKGNAESIWCIRIEAQFEGSDHSGWMVRWISRRLVAQSNRTRFWNTNATNKVNNFNTLVSSSDNIVILKANINSSGSNILGTNKKYGVIAQLLEEQNSPNVGLPDIHKLSILPVDTNDDGIPDDLLQSDILDMNYSGKFMAPIFEITGTTQPIFKLPNGRTFLVGHEDTDVTIMVDIDSSGTFVPYTFSHGDITIPPSHSTKLVIDSIMFLGASPDRPAPTSASTVKLIVKDYVYMYREDAISSWKPHEENEDIKTKFLLDDATHSNERRFTRHEGRYPLNFGWFHTSPNMHLIDPAPSNIIDMFIVTQGYYSAMMHWLSSKGNIRPVAPTPTELRNTYKKLLGNKMISDATILHSGEFKILFGDNADPDLRGRFKVIRPENTKLTDNEVKVQIVDIIRNFFDLENWNFAEQFFFTELATALHYKLGTEIDSVILVPTHAQNQFGDLFQVQTRENELFIPDISTTDIDIVSAYTPDNMRLNIK
jgi:hypothetical protein